MLHTKLSSVIIHLNYRFPAQESISGASKIPSIIYYDKTGKVRAVGAEAISDEVCERADDEGWVKSEW